MYLYLIIVHGSLEDHSENEVTPCLSKDYHYQSILRLLALGRQSPQSI